MAFFRGTLLRSVLPGESKHKDVRYLDIHEDDQFDEAQFAGFENERMTSRRIRPSRAAAAVFLLDGGGKYRRLAGNVRDFRPSTSRPAISAVAVMIRELGM